MIIEFVIGLILTWTFIYFIMKLIDQWKLKKLRKQFPEGTETKSIAVTRLDEVPISPVGEKVVSEEVTKALDTLKETPTEFPEVSQEDLKEDK